MLKRVHKIKFRGGRDANRSLIKKSVTDFIRYGKLEVSVKKAKVLKAVIDRLVHKAQRNTNADMNMLLRAIGDKKLITVLTTQVAPKFTDRTSGFVKMQRLGRRMGDGAEIARIEWVISMASSQQPVVSSQEDTKETEATKETKVSDKTEKKQAPTARVTATGVGKRMTSAPTVSKATTVKKRGDR